MTLTSVKGIGPATATKLGAAGVSTIDQLATADPAALASATGIAPARVAAWVAEAKARIAAPRAPDSADEPGAPAAAGHARRSTLERSMERLEHARVVLAEGIETARVKLENEVLAEVPILTARVKEDAQAKLKEFRGNVIVLKEKADTALLKLEEEIYEGLPVFKERLGDGAAEVRVRVKEIREKRLEPAARSLADRVRDLFARQENH